MLYFLIVLGLLAVLVLILAINTLRFKPGKDAEPFEPIPLDEEMLARNLSEMIRIRTVTSALEQDVACDAFLDFHAFLEKTYPLAHKTLERETVGTYSLLYRWRGTGNDKKPYILLAHMDVVPINEKTLDKWQYPPFSGEIANGYVWGRGALDCKGQLANIMESVEYLLADGFTPDRDIYIAFGHDEESMGFMGMQHIAQLLAERNLHFEFVFDEGGAVANGSVVGINRLVGAVGIAEKRCVNLRLSAQSKGGHAAAPPKRTANGDIARAIAAIEKHPFPAEFDVSLVFKLASICGYMKFPLNVIMANTWLTKPLLLKAFSFAPEGSAMVRTTMAATLVKGSHAINALAESPEAIVTMRLLPGQSLEKAVERVQKLVGDRVKVEVFQAHSYTPKLSGLDTNAYRTIKKIIEGLYPGCVTMPYLTMPVTDSRWLGGISDDIYRFEPHKSIAEDGLTIHGAGERITIESLREGTEFFIRLIRSV